MKKKLRKEKKIRKDLEKKNSENKALISFYESSPSVTSFTCNSVSTPGLTYFILEPVITEPIQNMNEFNDEFNDFNNNSEVFDHLFNFDRIGQFSGFSDPSIDLIDISE